MESYGPHTYGDRIADVYDEWYGGAFDIEGTVDFLAERAGEGPALELGIGTGRVALPLSRRGVEVRGIDASRAMVEVMRTKSGGDDIDVTIGDFAAVDVRGSYSLVYVVFNTLFALTSQRDQVACFRNVGERLAGEGVFVIECFAPDLTRFDRGQRVSVDRMSGDEVQLETSLHDSVNQRTSSRHTVFSAEGVKVYPVEIRYAYPPELDLMAELAGLRLRERHGGWRGEPFGPSSPSHVSVYEHA